MKITVPGLPVLNAISLKSETQYWMRILACLLFLRPFAEIYAPVLHPSGRVSRFGGHNHRPYKASL